eukprot:CAMPEP_0172650914 /NCGR_PEP_ID=MMETSP1068-20121228/242535_1 /TAXON_ID=35684 /ORGANISM="Pseudopedinella elastica, Strain CCMP716" /LENGTH=425 /DNA_ID=CAMNT_0013465291 /DNA_START=2047 /DNA_END=3324 /DNA_ORIENTATION=-
MLDAVMIFTSLLRAGPVASLDPSLKVPKQHASVSRRSFFQASATAAALAAPSLSSAASLDGYDPSSAVTRPDAGRSYFPPLTPPLTNRATYRYELGRDMWALEQLLVFANVSATVRTVVVKLQDGSLWVNGPQWPTGEFCALLDELGPVAHVVLGANALEHKAPMKAFTKKYPEASVWIVPGQYGPFGECGLSVASAKKMGYRVDGVLPVGAPKAGDPLPPWADEFAMRTLYVDLPENAGPVSEAAFFHLPTRTLVATDAVVFVPNEAPPIFSTYFDDALVSEPDFWPKSVLQAVFLPLRSGSGGDEAQGISWPGFDAVRGRLLRAPILRAFSDARAPGAVREWVKSVIEMGAFDRVETAHFASPIRATPAELLDSFAYLDGPSSKSPPIPCEDWALLDGLNTAIDTNKLGAPVVFDFKAGCEAN